MIPRRGAHTTPLLVFTREKPSARSRCSARVTSTWYHKRRATSASPALINRLMPSASELRDAFARFDANGDGFLTYNELVDIFTRLGGGNPMTDADARAFVERHDKNGDGRLDLEEFADALVVVQMEAHNPTVVRAAAAARALALQLHPMAGATRSSARAPSAPPGCGRRRGTAAPPGTTRATRRCPPRSSPPRQRRRRRSRRRTSPPSARPRRARTTPLPTRGRAP